MNNFELLSRSEAVVANYKFLLVTSVLNDISFLLIFRLRLQWKLTKIDKVNKISEFFFLCNVVEICVVDTLSL